MLCDTWLLAVDVHEAVQVIAGVCVVLQNESGGGGSLKEVIDKVGLPWSI